MSQLLYNTTKPELPPLDLKQYILSIVRENNLGSHLFIVPTVRLVRELEREITDEYFRSTSQPLPYLPLHTLNSFATQLHSHLTPGMREASMEIQIALMERAMRNVDLNYYAQPGKEATLGVVEHITTVINGVRADGILPSQFESDIDFAKENPDAGYDQFKLRDLANIYAEYIRILGDIWIDYPGRLLRVNNALYNEKDPLFRRSFRNVSHLLIHGHSEFTQPEIILLQQLGMVENLNVMIEFDYAENNGPLYGNFEEIISKLKMGGYDITSLDPIDITTPEEERRPFSHHMRQNLFRTDERIENSSFDRSLSLYSFKSREEEVRGIAGLIKHLIIEQKLSPEQLCVTSLTMDSYTELFRECLPSYGIPATITARFPLDQNGLITALFSALNIIAHNFDRRDVVRTVSSPYLSFGPEIDSAALADSSKKLRITRSFHSWTRRLEHRIEFLELHLTKLFDSEDRIGVETELEMLGRALISIRGVASFFESFKSSLTPVEFRSAVQELIHLLNVPQNILALRRNLDSRLRTPQDWQRIHDEMERDTRALAHFLRLLDELTELFETEQRTTNNHETDSENTSPTEVKRVRLSYYLDHLRTAAARSYYTIQEKHDYGVLVAPLKEISGLDYEVVILCGMVDGEFPSTYIPANFLGKPLEKTEERQLRRERIAFYSGLTSFRKQLFMTYPRSIGEKELVRSSFVDALLRITTMEKNGCVTEFNELRRERTERLHSSENSAPEQFVVSISTSEELAEEVGKLIWDNRELPRIDVTPEMLENLQHTASVERNRSDIASGENNEDGFEYLGRIGDQLDEGEQKTLGQVKGKTFSPSQLELYARCPFKYFARRVLHVEAAAQYDVSLTPLERGFLLHTILYRLYTELREQGLLPITIEEREDVLNRAREIAREEIEGINLDHPYWKIDQERLLGSEVLHGLLVQWIDSEIQRGEEKSELTPEFFEVAFGESSTHKESSDKILSGGASLELHNIKVRGRVDRVEIARVGDTVYYAVADYKTGRAPSRIDIENGLSLQFMLYLEVIRHLLAEHFALPLEQILPVGGIYYQLNARTVNTKDTYLFIPNELKGTLIQQRKSKRDPQTSEELSERIQRAFHHAEEYIEGIIGGEYGLTPHDINKVCTGCDYISVCRVSESK